MACTGTFATLRIFSRDISPDIIGKMLAITASEMMPIEPNSRYKPRREFNLWSWSTEGKINSVDNLEHVWKIIDLLNDKENVLANLREKGCSMDIFCYWDSTGQGGPHLDINTMESLLKLGLEISWDIYFEDES